MSRAITLLTLLAFTTLAHRPAHAHLMTWDSTPLPEIAAPAGGPVAQSPVTHLRSAFVLRDAQLDRRAFPPNAASGRRQLQRHFDVVLAALVTNFDRSVDVALGRLERARSENWSADERAAWRQTLAQRRLVNLQRLRLYQLRGVFPQNEGQADHAVPIFVDNHDTACAVGHLMRESGWTDEVAAIQRVNNLVYVPDVTAGPLVDWVLISGLTQEEAALIQPGYYPIGLLENRLDALTQGGSFTENGLTFDNFRLLAGELVDPDSFPEVLPVDEVDPTLFGAGVRQGSFVGDGRTLNPTYNDWIFLGVPNYGDVASLDRVDETWGMLFAYDVRPVNAAHRIAGAAIDQPISLTFNYAYLTGPGFFPDLLPGHIDVTSRIYALGASAPALAELNLNGGPNDPFTIDTRISGQDSQSFAPQQGISVVTAIRLEGFSEFGSLVQSFQVVPEPASGVVACLALALGLVSSRRR